jgi:hypothetical protein
MDLNPVSLKLCNEKQNERNEDQNYNKHKFGVFSMVYVSLNSLRSIFIKISFENKTYFMRTHFKGTDFYELTGNCSLSKNGSDDR